MKLSALSGVSSWEDEVRDFLKAEAAPYAQEIRTDALGNLIVFKKGAKAAGNKLLLCAHMDEVGLMIRHITDDGYLKFDTVGSIDRRVLLGKPVLVGPDRLPGVIGLKAYHLVSRDEEKSVPKLNDYYIDIGAKNREEAEKLVSLGDVAVFTTQPELFGDGLLKGKALDDRIGCAVLLTLLKEELPMDCTFVFTAQEEVGTRGAFGAAFSVTPELALVIEGTTAADLPDSAPIRRCAPWARVRCSPSWTGAPSRTVGCLNGSAPWQKRTRSPGSSSSLCLVPMTPLPSSAPRPVFVPRCSPRRCAMFTRPPAWPVSAIWTRC